MCSRAKKSWKESPLVFGVGTWAYMIVGLQSYRQYVDGLEGVTGGGGGVAISRPTIIISATIQGSSHGVN